MVLSEGRGMYALHCAVFLVVLPVRDYLLVGLGDSI